ncbi:MAG: hypothetical protein COV60_03275 [Candidatus Magasanikbacteria bacterium CG11_big_fil_rev_8_21_14_0_20_43_7]|uniref:Uncharacterized protein n=1 Tax=Candidatus Magasanikbacteria bacterium CG11_big_fil_rev_8_21_14_0_20_43_7 TaxID=1974654 RepID=A0A2H0N1V8_9BACT|nr:MAG: hypothetical protein COV60_03275 [Candidatus Magasanikbacteria bacterium CG11_big_fil_rev_8_21_14_0_20_43_7]
MYSVSGKEYLPTLLILLHIEQPKFSYENNLLYMKRLIFPFILLFVICFVSIPSASVASGDNFGLETTASNAGLSQKYGQPVTALIGNVIGTALSLVSVLFFVLMIFFGFKWMLDRGKGEDAKQALDGIIAAIIGIIIVLASYAITSFVFNSLGSSGGAGGGGSGGGIINGNGNGQIVAYCLDSKNTTCTPSTSGDCPGGILFTYAQEIECKGNIPEISSCSQNTDCKNKQICTAGKCIDVDCTTNNDCNTGVSTGTATCDLATHKCVAGSPTGLPGDGGITGDVTAPSPVAETNGAPANTAQPGAEPPA